MLSLKSNAQISTYPYTQTFGNSSCALPSGFLNGGSDPWDFRNTSQMYMLGGDHTTGSGCYASMDDTGIDGIDDTCILTTPAFDLTNVPKAQMHFWWQNAGINSSPSSIGPRPWSDMYLDVSIDSGSTWTPNVWSVTDSQQIGWVKAYFPLSPYISTKTMFRFRGIETRRYQSDLSLDDITVYQPPNNDASVTSVIGLESKCFGYQYPSVVIQNFGADTLTSANIGWIVNGATQNSASYTGSLPPYSKDTIALDSFYMIANQPYDISVFTSLPNGQIDAEKSNDTLHLNDHKTGMSGTYLVGINQVYPTLKDAVKDLNSRGICNSVLIKVDSNVYTGRITIGPIFGTDTGKTVSIIGNNSKLLANPDSTTKYIVGFNNADHVTFKDFKIKSQNNDYAYGIFLFNGSDYNTVDNCFIDLRNVTSNGLMDACGILIGSSPAYATAAGVNKNADYNTFSNNTIDAGINGVYHGIRVNGNNNYKATSNKFIGNTIKNIYATSIYLYNNNNTILSGNDIYRPDKTSTASTYTGIELAGGNIKTEIFKNKIHNPNDNIPSSYGDVFGLYFNDCDAPSGQENKAYNNLFYNLNKRAEIRGIVNKNSNGTHMYYNTISIDDTTDVFGFSFGFYQTGTASNIVFRNNSISITRPSNGNMSCLYYATGNSSISSDYNNLYISPFGNYTGWRRVITWYNTFTHGGDLEYLQSINNNIWDQHSVSEYPKYIDIANDDLTPTTQGMNNGALVTYPIASDFFDSTRSTSYPDIGAIEFSPYCHNDTCYNAELIEKGKFYGSTELATYDSVNTCDSTPGSTGVWYEYHAKGDYVNFSLCGYGTNFDAKMSLYSGICDSLVCLSNNNNYCGLSPEIGLCTDSGEVYFLMIYGNGNAKGDFTLNVDEQAIYKPSFTSSTPHVCAGDSIALTVDSIAQSYQWNNNKAGQSIFVDTSGWYHVNVEDLNGCIMSSDSMFINYYTFSLPLPNIIYTPDTVMCTGDTTTLTSSPGVSYSWNNSQASTSQIIKVKNAGTYWVTVSDINGCKAQSPSINISVHSLPSIFLGNDTLLCSNDSLLLDAGFGFKQYSWSTGDTNQMSYYKSINPGVESINVQVTDSNDCVGSDKIVVLTIKAIEVDLGNDTILCSWQSMQLDAGNVGVKYQWSTGDTTQTISYSASNGSTNISVIVTAQNKCESTDDIDITADPCAGIYESNNEADLRIYPNPSNGQVKIDLLESNINKAHISLRDINGKLVFSEHYALDNTRVINLTLSHLPSGIYSLIVQGNNINLNKKLIIQ